MALSDTTFATNLKAVFDKMEQLKPDDTPMTKQEIAEELAKCINAQIKTLEAKIVIPTASVIVSVTGQATGVPNTAPLDLTQVQIS
jgi:hypothetical protein